MHPKTEKTRISLGINKDAMQKANQASQEPLKVRKMPNNDFCKIPVGARLYPFRKRWRGAAHFGTIKTGLSWTWKRRPPKLKKLRQRHSKALDRILKELKIGWGEFPIFALGTQLLVPVLKMGSKGHKKCHLLN